MAGISERLTATEAAAVSCVNVRDVNRVFEENILPDYLLAIHDGQGRHVEAAGCTLIAFYFESANKLTAGERLWTIEHAGPRLRGWAGSFGAAKRELFLDNILNEDWTFKHEFLTIDLKPFVQNTWNRLRRLFEARGMVVTSPDILSGTPVIAGTRIPVYDVAASVTSGIPRDRILEAYPNLTADQVELAPLYAEAVPPRGRPRRSAALPKGATIITDRRVSRRRNAE
ncbi:MAG: DUF433 domain-containing protein [Rhodomicrobium sp.]|nr:DUF433 domain-containing protein [Rhodomicrobium sp.]